MAAFRTTIVLAILLSAFPARAHAQWQGGNLAVYTNGNMFQSGDQLKVELIALESINEPFAALVSYSFTETIIERDKDDKESTKQVLRTKSRSLSPVIESIAQFKTAVLDDTFHFGEGNPTGLYQIDVAIYGSGGKDRLSTLHSCVFFQERDKWKNDCPLYVRSLKRVNDERWITFDGRFSDRARYSATLISNEKVVQYIEIGAYSRGENELDLSSTALSGTTGKTFDILIHDHLNNYSSTLGRVTIPSAR